ncbi:methionyl-tRNA formyltransferase [Clostridium collagenovorans DSM 3089]|uniref:Methionyl-tRNA formyltransferase n=1 Tax=Clostridium collagenovorans DSM 3089 TaxID=1121306 RepID=A0A1M5SSK5_9CLOT|nr:methionyl-tRNA formyltransferase [Clostridium collagenovorans]SHH41288.1 methionyl-tRNA formyltransferase [Clostridium collagenovorans DSM 3089]
MKIVFMGTPDFSVPTLEKLIDNTEVVGVLTQPDKPKGRGKKMSISPVKEVALQHNIPVYQPIRLRKDTELIEKLRELAPDFIVVVAFGQILSQEVLDIPKYGCINLHASLLPKYRGAAPLNWAIIRGEKVSGNTTMLMDAGLDTGDMLLKQEVEITENMTAGDLHDILCAQGADLLLETLHKLKDGEIKGIKQGEAESEYASMLNKDIAKINWNSTSGDIHNFVRGLNPWPIAHTSYKDMTIKIYETRLTEKDSNKEPGTIVNVSKEGMMVSTSTKDILVKTIQVPGKKTMNVGDYIRGNEIEVNVVLK